MVNPARPLRIELIVAHDPLLLLERAADGFLTSASSTAEQPFPSPHYLLALRQGGLRDDLLRLAAERGVPGWFDPPLCIFHELPDWLGSTARLPCDDVQRGVILDRVLRQYGGSIFGRLRRPEDFLRALDRLFGELRAEDVAPGQFRAAMMNRTGRDDFECARDRELEALYRGYVETLDADGLRDGRDMWLDCARAVASDAGALGSRLGHRRELRLMGLQDLRGGWRTLLSALAASPALERLVVYTAEPLELAGLDVQVTSLEAPDTLAARLAVPSATPTPTPTPTPTSAAVPQVALLSAPDVERELDEVARRVRVLADAGVSLRRIGIVTRQPRPYLDLMLAALDRFGVPGTARRRFALREVPVLRAVRALFAAAADRWCRHSLVELAEQPYLATGLDASMLNFAGYRRRLSGLDAWSRALHQLAADAAAAEATDANDRGDDPRRAFPPSTRLGAAAAGLDRFGEQVRELDRPRVLAEWLEWLGRFLAEDPWRIEHRMHEVPADRFDVVRLDLAGWRAARDLVERWRHALERWGHGGDRLDAAQFRAKLDDLLSTDAALWTPVQRGVPVLEALAAAYRTFDHIFVIGAEAGAFPAHPPRSPILDERERAALARQGIPFESREVWDAREKELFRVLVAGARQGLTLSWSRVDASGRDTIRSALVETLAEVAGLDPDHDVTALASSEIVIAGARLYTASDAPARAAHAWRVERLRRSGEPSPYNGLVQDPALVAWLAAEFGDERRWSPTQLESYAKCPWSFFSRRLLHVSRLDDPDEDMDAATRGTMAHDALRRFFEAAGERAAGPVLLREADRVWAAPLLERAVVGTFDAAAHRWLGHATLVPARRAELRRLLLRYLDFEIEHNEKMFNNRTNNAFMLRTGVVEHELAFDDVVLERRGVRFRFQGFIDRVEIGIDERLPSDGFVAAVDYKSSVYAAPGGGSNDADAPWRDHVVLQLPLYAYALTVLKPDARVARVEYRALKQRKKVHALELVQVERRTGVRRDNDAARERMEGALDAVADHVLRIRRGEFPAAPAASCGCPSFCHALEICRVQGGPKLQGG